MSARWLVIVSLGLAGCGVAGAQEPVPAPVPAAAPPQEPATPPVAEPVGPTLADYDVIAHRNPFSAAPPRAPEPVTPPVAPVDPTPEDPPPPPTLVPKKNLSLTAVFMSGGAPAALLERAGKPPISLRVGDAFLEGKVTRIDLDRIAITIGETEREILVGERFADGTELVPEGQEDRPAAPAPTTSKSTSGTTSLLTPEEQQLPPDERRKLLIQRMKERREQQRAK